MRTVIAATAFTLFAGIPASAVACERIDDASASAAPGMQVASAPAPAVSKAPEAKAVKGPDAVRKYADKSKADKSDQKVAAIAPN